MAIDFKTGNRISREDLRKRVSELTKTQATAQDIDEHVERLKAESDRGVMILAATMLEDALRVALGRTMPGANGRLMQQIFSNGPLSNFSNRIVFAEAGGLVSPRVARQMDVIRGIRNAAAHSHAAVDFSLDQVKQYLATMFEDNKMADDFETWSQAKVRNFYLQICGYLADYLIGGAGGLEAAATNPEAIHGFYRALKASDLDAA